MTDDGESIVAYLNILATVRGKKPKGVAYMPEELLLKFGEEFTITPNTFKGRRWRMKACWRNAALLVLKYPERKLTYTEGYMNSHGLPIPHAWAVDEAGNVIDPTIKGGDGVLGYYGIRFSHHYLIRISVGSGTWSGLLDSMENPELYRLGPPDGAILSPFSKTRAQEIDQHLMEQQQAFAEAKERVAS